MNTNLTDITLVVDRSGSMEAIRTDAEGGVNTFLTDQAAQPGEALVTLVHFDTQYEFVHKGVPVKDVPRYQLVPRGSTALLDAIGRAINETGERLALMAETDRPALVVFVVMTDGQENSSQEFTKAQIKKMIEHQQSVYNWQFTFLGANQDSFAEAGSMGMAAAGVANFTADKVAYAMKGTSAKVARMRKQTTSGEIVSNEFTADERDSME
jgi:Mg-chelatase subunit ChlD